MAACVEISTDGISYRDGQLLKQKSLKRMKSTKKITVPEWPEPSDLINPYIPPVIDIIKYAKTVYANDGFGILPPVTEILAISEHAHGYTLLPGDVHILSHAAECYLHKQHEYRNKYIEWRSDQQKRGSK